MDKSVRFSTPDSLTSHFAPKLMRTHCASASQSSKNAGQRVNRAQMDRFVRILRETYTCGRHKERKKIRERGEEKSKEAHEKPGTQRKSEGMSEGKAGREAGKCGVST